MCSLRYRIHRVPTRYCAFCFSNVKAEQSPMRFSSLGWLSIATRGFCKTLALVHGPLHYSSRVFKVTVVEYRYGIDELVPD